MKIYTNAAELRDLGARSRGYNVFKKVHGDKDVLFSEALKSNGWDDMWRLLSKISGKLSKQQQKDLHLLGCKFARSTLENYTKLYNNDDRPRKAIDAKEKWLNGEITDEELSAACSAAELAAESAACSAAWSVRSAACSAAWSARSVVWSVVWSAAWSARSAAWSEVESPACSAARSEAWSAAESKFISNCEKELLKIFMKWESESK